MIAIGFSTSTSLISKAIRWFTRSKVSHVWILHEAYGDCYVMDSVASGFRVVPYEYFLKRNRVYYLRDVEDDLRELNIDPVQRLHKVAKWLGRPYDFLGIVRFLLRPLFFWRPVSTPRKMICSEAVVRFAPELFPGINPEWATPKSLLEVFQAHADSTD